jgi:inosine-uridine nucleoside N-ribohydrolase
MRPAPTHAAIKLVELVQERPNYYDILALGPLTNLAVAAAIDPLFLSRVKSLTGTYLFFARIPTSSPHVIPLVLTF